jgi:hypothetical protein
MILKIIVMDQYKKLLFQCLTVLIFFWLILLLTDALRAVAKTVAEEEKKGQTIQINDQS